MERQIRHRRFKKSLLGLFCAIALISLDQYTKRLAVGHLRGQAPIVLWEGVFELRYLENFGMAFGMLQNQRILFLVMTLIMLLVIVYFYLWRIPPERRFRWLDVIAVLFFSGAIGNFIDRFSHSYVVDFFYFSLIDFPIFNVADIYVTVGAFLLLFLGFFYYGEDDFELVLPSGKKREPDS